MTSENGTNMYMPVAPAYGYGYGGGNGGGLFGGDWWGIILVILLLGGGMWGGFGGMGGFGGYGNMMLGYDFPWLLNGQQGINANTNAGFRDAMLNDGITSIRDGISGLSTQLCGCCGDMQMAMANGFSGVQQSLCNGFAGTTAAITGAQNALTQQLYSNEIASLNRSFAEQSANAQGFNGVQSSLCDAKYASATNTRDILDNQNRTSQMIMDKLCALELDGVKGQLAAAQRENLGLQNQLNMANLAASQTAQTGNIRDAIIGELRSCPIPAQPVYGSQPIFTCNGNGNGFGCGCGCAA